MIFLTQFSVRYIVVIHMAKRYFAAGRSIPLRNRLSHAFMLHTDEAPRPSFGRGASPVFLLAKREERGIGSSFLMTVTLYPTIAAKP